ncbi:porin [Marinobacter halotolerans]|uniref:porin n=1 Tax=Marinobacter halotolerans TaxID=1569211 RepID=UPI001248156B|nr:porin [Marinobacter halotolerans]
MRFSKSILAAGLFSIAASPTQALEVEVGGQVNRAIMFAKDGYNADQLGLGSDQEFYHVDNRNSPTRFNIGGTQRIIEGWTAGALIEVGVFANASNDVDPAQKNTGPEIDERITDVFVDSPYGKLTLGMGEGAAYDAGRRDYSGTGVISFRNPSLIGGELRFKLKPFPSSVRRRPNRTPPETNPFDEADPFGNEVSISGSIRDYNFDGRHQRIRYDSPRIGPVTISASAGHDGSDGQDSIVQFGIKSGLRVPGGRMLIGAGYSRATQNFGDPNANLCERYDPSEDSFEDDCTGNLRTDAPDVSTYGGSVSYFHSDTGLNLTLAAVNRAEDLTEEEATDTFDATNSELGQFRYVKFGYRPNRTHAFDIHYGETRDRNKNDEKGSVVGVGYVYSPTDLFDAYAGAKVHSHERAEWCTTSGNTCYAPQFEDITIVTTGLRVKF